MSEAFYDPEKDKKALETLNVSKDVVIVGFTKIYTVISWIIFLVTGTTALLVPTGIGIGLVVPLWIVASILMMSILLIYLALYLPGTILATMMTIFDPMMETVEDESLTSTMTRLALNGSLGWLYVENRLLGSTRFSSILFG